MGNQVGEPTGQTHAVLFFDQDDDGDPDLWVANDGDRLHVYRNDSSPGRIQVHACGSGDGHRQGRLLDGIRGRRLRWRRRSGCLRHEHRLPSPAGRPAQSEPGGSCAYHEAFSWGTCLHFLLKNEGVSDVPGYGPLGTFRDVACLHRRELRLRLCLPTRSFRT